MRGLVAVVIISLAGLTAARAEAAFPGQNGQIVFAHASPDQPGLYLVNPDGTAARRIVASADPNIFQPLWSPDGTHILYDDSSQNFDGSIRVVDAGGGGMRVAVEGVTSGGPILGAAWTADGRVSWAARATVLGKSNGICQVVEGEAQARFCVAPPPGEARGNLRQAGRWSSTGRFAWVGSRLPVAAFEQSDELDLVSSGASAWAAGGGGGEETVVTQTRASRFDWSPDGAKLVFQSSGGIGVVNADGTGEHLLGHKGSTPAWSPDGKKIVFNDGKGIAVMNADGSGLVRVTSYEDDLFPDWRPAASAYVPPASSSGGSSAAPAAPKASPGSSSKPAAKAKKPKPKKRKP